MDPVTHVLSCLAKGAQNAACSATAPCIETLRCDGVTGTCQPRLMSGEACGTTDDCASASPYCDQAIGCKCDIGLSFGAGSLTCADYGGGVTPTPACSGSAPSPDAGTSNTDAGSDASAG
jgi:hypothetical protein